MEVGLVKTPQYILRDGNHPIRPSITGQTQPATSGTEANVIFAFSDKPEYDLFLKSGAVPLTPYPLVKRFLSDRLNGDNSPLQLVVIDAAGSEQPILYAATFQSVLDAMVAHSDSVVVSHKLIFERSSHSYSIEVVTPAVVGDSV